MDSRVTANPFASLFEDASTAKTRSNDSFIQRMKDNQGLGGDIYNSNHIIETVFRITLDDRRQLPRHPQLDAPRALLSLRSLNSGYDEQVAVMFIDRLGEYLDDRLFGGGISEDGLVFANDAVSEEDMQLATRKSHLIYLFEAFSRQLKLSNMPVTDILQSIRQKIVDYAVCILGEPEILTIPYAEHNLRQQLVNIIVNHDNLMNGYLDPFLRPICAQLHINPGWIEKRNFYHLLTDIATRVLPKNASLFNRENEYTLALYTELSRTPALAQSILSYHGGPRETGISYQDSPLGRLISPSHLPPMEIGPFDFFDRPTGLTQQEVDIQNRNIWTITQPHWQKLDSFFETMFRHISTDEGVKSALFTWFACCLECNKDRAKMGMVESPMPMTLIMGDGMSMNLSWILLGLCRPVLAASEGRVPKSVLKISPFYAADKRPGKIFMQNIYDETTLIARPSEDVPPTSNYSSLTELFYLTHKSLQLSYVALCDRFMHLNEHLHRLEDTWRYIVERNAQQSPMGERVKEAMERKSSLFFNYTAALTSSQFLERSFRFLTTSAEYLCQLALYGWSSDGTEWQPLNELPEENISESSKSNVLGYVPEFVATNVVELALRVSRTNEDFLESSGVPLDSMLSFVIIFMGSPSRMRNPHLRAKLASVLEVLMPFRDDQSDLRNTIGVTAFFHRQQLFDRHPLVKHLVEALLNVFVTIEMTGEGVEFEEKFRYRRPMYAAMRYMDTEDRYTQQSKMLEAEALACMEDANAPLYLRFVNLLINDAIFLLDEAMDYLQQLKQKERERGFSGEWTGLPSDDDNETPEAREQRRSNEEASFRHMGNLARFHCLLGANTISRLCSVSRQTPAILTHSLLVDRVTAMLNYFVLRLAGPKRCELKVGNMEKYAFNPSELLSTICTIVCNLGSATGHADAVERFRKALIRDRRSFSINAYNLAYTRVLPRVMASDVLEQFGKVFEALKERAASEAAEEAQEEALEEEAPEEFLDPILGSLMTDPVCLPSSGQIVDRSTIARHILSDQTDPFNRSPLSMNMVEPQTELKNRIEAWIQSRRT